MRRKKTDWEKMEDGLEGGRVELRKQLGLPPYVPHGQREKSGYAQTPKFKATSKRAVPAAHKNNDL